MARTREQWNAVIDDYAILAGLSTSAVADWKLLRDTVVTIAMWFEINIFSLFKADIDDTLNRKQFGTLPWYVEMCKEFQSGDSLAVVNGIVGYDPIDATHRIVTQASAKELDGTVVLKVAKTVNGDIAALSGGELSDFKNYAHARRSPGVKTNIYSYPPNLVKYTGSYLFDTLYDNEDVDELVMQAITAFRDNFRFDATLYMSELQADIKNVAGVVDVNIEASVWDAANALWMPIQGHADLDAGYFNWDNASGLTPNPAP